jgi:hypothetical protein
MGRWSWTDDAIDALLSRGRQLRISPGRAELHSNPRFVEAITNPGAIRNADDVAASLFGARLMDYRGRGMSALEARAQVIRELDAIPGMTNAEARAMADRLAQRADDLSTAAVARAGRGGPARAADTPTGGGRGVEGGAPPAREAPPPPPPHSDPAKNFGDLVPVEAERDTIRTAGRMFEDGADAPPNGYRAAYDDFAAVAERRGLVADRLPGRARSPEEAIRDIQNFDPSAGRRISRQELDAGRARADELDAAAARARAEAEQLATQRSGAEAFSDTMRPHNDFAIDLAARRSRGQIDATPELHRDVQRQFAFFNDPAQFENALASAQRAGIVGDVAPGRLADPETTARNLDNALADLNAGRRIESPVVSREEFEFMWAARRVQAGQDVISTNIAILRAGGATADNARQIAAQTDAMARTLGLVQDGAPRTTNVQDVLTRLSNGEPVRPIDMQRLSVEVADDPAALRVAPEDFAPAVPRVDGDAPAPELGLPRIRRGEGPEDAVDDVVDASGTARAADAGDSDLAADLAAAALSRGTDRRGAIGNLLRRVTGRGGDDAGGSAGRATDAPGAAPPVPRGLGRQQLEAADALRGNAGRLVGEQPSGVRSARESVDDFDSLSPAQQWRQRREWADRMEAHYNGGGTGSRAEFDEFVKVRRGEALVTMRDETVNQLMELRRRHRPGNTQALTARLEDTLADADYPMALTAGPGRSPRDVARALREGQPISRTDLDNFNDYFNAAHDASLAVNTNMFRPRAWLMGRPVHESRAAQDALWAGRNSALRWTNIPRGLFIVAAVGPSLPVTEYVVPENPINQMVLRIPVPTNPAALIGQGTAGTNSVDSLAVMLQKGRYVGSGGGEALAQDIERYTTDYANTNVQFREAVEEVVRERLGDSNAALGQGADNRTAVAFFRARQPGSEAWRDGIINNLSLGQGNNGPDTAGVAAYIREALGGGQNAYAGFNNQELAIAYRMERPLAGQDQAITQTYRNEIIIKASDGSASRFEERAAGAYIRGAFAGTDGNLPQAMAGFENKHLAMYYRATRLGTTEQQQAYQAQLQGLAEAGDPHAQRVVAAGFTAAASDAAAARAQEIERLRTERIQRGLSGDGTGQSLDNGSPPPPPAPSPSPDADTGGAAPRNFPISLATLQSKFEAANYMQDGAGDTLRRVFQTSTTSGGNRNGVIDNVQEWNAFIDAAGRENLGPAEQSILRSLSINM